jgi:ABC-type bacteriocin/lantibiotic exporter with double-glycine peptidase domain
MVDPVSAFSAFIAFGSIYTVLYFFVKRVLGEIGADRLSANTARFKSSSETFSLIKEIKISGKEGFYLSAFDDATKRFTDKETSMQAISALPRYFIEMIVFTAMISIILSNLSDDFVLSSIIPILALYAFAAYRLIPSLQVIFGNITLFKASISYLDSLTDKYQELDITGSFKTDSKRLGFKDRILLDNISFRYPEEDKDALSQIHLEIPSFNIIGIIGSTGSGKTTIVDVILGLLKSRKGGLYVDGTEVTKENVRQWQSSVGYVPQHISLVDESISANIALGEDPDNLDMKSVISAATVASIHDFIISDLKEGYETKVGDKGVRLSGGQRQRIGIARALYNKPDVLVLDEATSALDDETEQAVMDAVNNLGRELTIVIIAHRLSTLSKADIVYRLEKGRLHSKGSYEDMCKISGD